MAQSNKIQNKNEVKSKFNGNDDKKKNYHLYLIFAVLCILPFIVRYMKYKSNLNQFTWFPNQAYSEDFFLLCKQRVFLVISSIMTLYLLYAVISKRKFKNSKIFIPLAVYALLAILSTIFSDYPSFSLTGSYSMFESVFVLLGYCVVAYYTYQILNDEKDFRYVYYFIVILSLVMGIMGTFQYLGYDFFSTELGKNLILPYEVRQMGLDIDFIPNSVYLTLLNPNYVGVLCSLLIPVLLVMTLMYKKVLWTILSTISIISLSISLVGSKSLSGVIAIAVAVVCIIILVWRYLFKYFYISFTVLIIIISAAYFADKYTNHYFSNKIKSALTITKTEPDLTSIESKDDMVTVTYKGNELNLIFALNSDSTAEIFAFDQNYATIESTFELETGVYTITDERFAGITYGFDEEIDGVFYVNVGGKKWRFTNISKDQTYYYLNRFYKLDKIINPPAAFRGYDIFGSHRGYIWSRSLPLLKNTILLGTGPDTYVLYFPQNDYLAFYQAGFEESIINKPHCMYLQIGIQTGVLSLAAFVVFYLIYFISSVKLYIRSRFSSFYAKLGLAIFVGTIGYMVSGLANDSNLGTSPIFWTLMGVGIAVNSKAKPLILNEIAEHKEKKEAKKASIKADHEMED